MRHIEQRTGQERRSTPRPGWEQYRRIADVQRAVDEMVAEARHASAVRLNQDIGLEQTRDQLLRAGMVV